MNKKIVVTLSLLLALGSACAYAKSVDQLQPLNGDASNSADNSADVSADMLGGNKVYYPNANIKSVIAKYKAGNYTGCLQELFSLVKKDPSNALAYYYMAMAYTHINLKDEAVAAYEKVIALNPNEYLVDYAVKGRDCLTDGPACQAQQAPEEMSELDKFINAPYGNGLSPELNQEVEQKELTNIKETINQKEQLEQNDIQRIKEFDKKKLENNYSSELQTNEKIAQVSDEDVLKAIQTLKDAGLNLTVQSENPYAGMMQYQDPKMAEVSMLLGNNNNNNANSMMNMLPMLMSQAQNGKNVDPRLMQAVMMNSMLPDFTFNNDDNRY